MSIKYKPLYKWGSLNVSPSERRRLICNSVFNLVSMVCIFWSIYVLIERAAQDAHNGQIDWSFYVKISVVTIGLIIGVIFLFVQLKLYISIFIRWKQSNRIIVIRNANFTNNSNNTSAKRKTSSSAINMGLSNNNNNSNNDNNRDPSNTELGLVAAASPNPSQVAFSIAEPQVNRILDNGNKQTKDVTGTNLMMSALGNEQAHVIQMITPSVNVNRIQ